MIDVARPSLSLVVSMTSNALAHHSWWSASPFLARRFTAFSTFRSIGAKHRRDCVGAGFASPHILFCPCIHGFPAEGGCKEEVGELEFGGHAVLLDTSKHLCSATHVHHIHVCTSTKAVSSLHG